ISFEAVEGATYYKVSVNGKEYIRETPGLALIDLKPGTTYEWAVQAGNAAGEGRSTTGSFLTLPGKVENLSASATEDAISMRWDPVKSATSYRIYDTELNLLDEVEKTAYLQSELQPGTDYTFILEAINASGTGQRNSISYVTVPSQPAGAAVTNITEDAAEIRIPTVSGAVYYEVNFEGELYTLQEDMLQLTALEPGTTYPYSVAAGNQAGKSKSYDGEFTTLPDTVLNLSAQPLDSKRVCLQWSPVKSADYYRVYNAEGQVIETASDPAIIMEQLTPGTSYEFSVSAVNGSGEGKKSTVSSMTIPDQIADLTIGEVTETEATLSFESVTGATYYTLNVNNIESRIASDQQEIELKHLTPGTKYSVGLAAGNESGQGE
ncbi:fibronectin type III domain-containing protein, partial [Paenibacillus provencensis]